MKAKDILWDADCADDVSDLPAEITIPDGMSDDDEISNYITDLTGFCHKGFVLEK